MTAVVGIDPSLRATGLARITIAEMIGLDRVAETWVRRSTGHARDDLGRRHDRLVGITADVLAWSLPCALVVIEGPSLGSVNSGSLWDRAGLWWRIVARLLDREIPVAVVPPRSRAKWISGNGNADKTTVHTGICRLWHPYWHPTRAGDDNESDALVLASMGAQWLGLLPTNGTDGPDPAALAGAEWPDREAIA